MAYFKKHCLKYKLANGLIILEKLYFKLQNISFCRVEKIAERLKTKLYIFFIIVLST